MPPTIILNLQDIKRRGYDEHIHALKKALLRLRQANYTLRGRTGWWAATGMPE